MHSSVAMGLEGGRHSHSTCWAGGVWKGVGVGGRIQILRGNLSLTDSEGGRFLLIFGFGHKRRFREGGSLGRGRGQGRQERRRGKILDRVGRPAIEVRHSPCDHFTRKLH